MCLEMIFPDHPLAAETRQDAIFVFVSNDVLEFDGDRLEGDQLGELGGEGWLGGLGWLEKDRLGVGGTVGWGSIGKGLRSLGQASVGRWSVGRVGQRSVGGELGSVGQEGSVQPYRSFVRACMNESCRELLLWGLIQDWLIDLTDEGINWIELNWLMRELADEGGQNKTRSVFFSFFRVRSEPLSGKVGVVDAAGRHNILRHGDSYFFLFVGFSTYMYGLSDSLRSWKEDRPAGARSPFAVPSAVRRFHSHFLRTQSFKTSNSRTVKEIRRDIVCPARNWYQRVLVGFLSKVDLAI
jgi:hypothetical protein